MYILRTNHSGYLINHYYYYGGMEGRCGKIPTHHIKQSGRHYIMVFMEY